MTILCATNFSPEAVAAATFAGELAKLQRQAMWLAYVMPVDTARVFGDQVLATVDGALKGEADRLRKLGATVNVTVLLGKLHVALPAFVEAKSVSLVIAGDTARLSSGSGALARLGQHLQTPFWAVRNADKVMAWARGERPLKVVVGVDHTRSSDEGLRWVEALSKFGKLDVVAAHIFFPPAEYHRFGLPLPRTWNAEHPALLEALHRELEVRLPAALVHRVRLVAAMGRVSDHLTALATEEAADVLVLGTHHRQAISGLWSVSEQCLQGAPMSVVSVPAAEGARVPSHAIARASRVLIATDFSATGDRAVAWGLGIVAPGGRVDLIHVTGTALSVAEHQKVIDQLVALVPSEMHSRGVEINMHARVGETTAEILTAAERFSSSVICLGSRGRSELKSLVFGSTAQGVLQASKRPVLVVRPEEP